jgi:hypothetical protein
MVMKLKYLSLFATLALLAAAILGCSQNPNPQAPVIAAQPQAQPQSSAGMVVHKDPVTGRFVPATEASAQSSKETANALSMSQEGLVEVPAPGGGFMVDLRGRFQQAMSATTNADGTVTVECGQHERRKKD